MSLMETECWARVWVRAAPASRNATNAAHCRSVSFGMRSHGWSAVSTHSSTVGISAGMLMVL